MGEVHENVYLKESFHIFHSKLIENECTHNLYLSQSLFKSYIFAPYLPLKGKKIQNEYN